MIGAPFLLLEFILPYLFGGVEPNGQLLGALEIVYLGGWISSVIGMRQLRATGNSGISKTMFAVQLAGLFLALTFTVLQIARPNLDPNSLLLRVTDLAWPGSHLFMLFVGIAIIAGRVWRGWRRLPALLCGAGLPLFFALGPVVGPAIASIPFAVLTAVGFMSLGYAVRTGERASGA